MGCPAFSELADRFGLPIVRVSSRTYELAVIGLVFSFKLTPNEVVFAVHMGGDEIESADKIGSVWCAMSR